MDPEFVSAIVQAAEGKKVNVAGFCALPVLLRPDVSERLERDPAECRGDFLAGNFRPWRVRQTTYAKAASVRTT